MMPDELPKWAMTGAGPGDRARVLEAHEANLARFEWGDPGAVRAWARDRGWPAPRLFFERAFRNHILSSDEDFDRAITESGLSISIPHTHYRIDEGHLNELDEAYDEGMYRWLVEALREIRRAVQAGVTVEVEGRKLKSFDAFYQWAHGRYHALEDGYDSWIGDDDT